MTALIINYLSKHRAVLPLLITLVTLAMLALTLMPLDQYIQGSIWSYDKAGHLIIFGTWTYLLGLYQMIHHAGKFSMFTIFILGVGFGVAIEVLQYLLPLNRSAELFDIAFDSLGSLLAVIFLYKSASAIPNRESEKVADQT